jgi:hypothetical protein
MAIGQAFADVATLVLVQVSDVSTDQIAERVQESISARSVIEQARVDGIDAGTPQVLGLQHLDLLGAVRARGKQIETAAGLHHEDGGRVSRERPDAVRHEPGEDLSRMVLGEQGSGGCSQGVERTLAVSHGRVPSLPSRSLKSRVRVSTQRLTVSRVVA